MLGSEIAESYGGFIPSFLRTLHSCFLFLSGAETCARLESVGVLLVVLAVVLAIEGVITIKNQFSKKEVKAE